MDEVLVLLRPGDRVLVVMRGNPDEDERKAYMHALTSHFPGVKFLLMTDCTGVVVVQSPVVT